MRWTTLWSVVSCSFWLSLQDIGQRSRCSTAASTLDRGRNDALPKTTHRKLQSVTPMPSISSQATILGNRIPVNQMTRNVDTAAFEIQSTIPPAIKHSRLVFISELYHYHNKGEKLSLTWAALSSNCEASNHPSAVLLEIQISVLPRNADLATTKSVLSTRLRRLLGGALNDKSE